MMIFSYPFAWIVLTYSMGILSHQKGMTPNYLILFSFSLLSPPIVFTCMKIYPVLRRGRFIHHPPVFFFFPVCLMACFVLGHLNSELAEKIPPAHIYYFYQSQLINAPEAVVLLEGKLDRDPSLSGEKLYLFMTVSALRHRRIRYETEGRIRLSLRCENVREVSETYRAGQRIRAHARLFLPGDARNPGSFSYRAYLQRKGIRLTGTVKSPRLIKVAGYEKSGLLTEMTLRIRRSIRTSIDRHFSSDAQDVMKALLIGDRGEMADETKEDLKRTGVYHILAISGMHVGILCYLIFRSLTFLGHYRLASFLCILLALGYASVADWSAPVSRAAVMACCFFFGKMAGLRGNIINTLALSSFIYLLLRPLHLFDPGFQLTFTATLGIITMVPALTQRIPRLQNPIGSLFAASVCAQLSLLPLSCLYFHRVTPFAIFANLFFVPLLGFTLATALCFLVLCAMSPAAAGYVAMLPGSAVIWMKGAASWIGGFAWSSYRIPGPYAWVIAGYFISLALLQCRRIPVLIRITAFCPFLFMLAIYPFPPRSVRDLTLTFLDVGNGRAILVELPGREKILVDGGGFFGSTFDTGEYIVSPALWKYGVKRLRAVVASHGHFDHYGGLFAVLENFRVDSLYCGGIVPPGGGYAALIKKASEKKIPLLFPDVSEQCHMMDTDILFTMPGKNNPALLDENDRSMVLYLKYGGRGILLPSDLEKDGGKRLMDISAIEGVAVLEAPHHGSKHAGAAFLMQHFTPVVVVISGESRPGRNGLDDTEAMCRRAGASVYRTDRDGAVTVTINAKSVQVSPFVRNGDNKRWFTGPEDLPGRYARKR